MAFVRDCFLAQVSAPAAEQFDPRAILVNGLFLAFKAREAKKNGFECTGSLPAELSDVEFPCWLIQDSKRGVLFCRGELVRDAVTSEPQQLYDRWDVRLSPKYLAQLPKAISQFAASTDGGVKIGPGRLLGIPGSDVRYHPNRDAILADTGAEIGEPHVKEIARRSAARLKIYERALRPA